MNEQGGMDKPGWAMGQNTKQGLEKLILFNTENGNCVILGQVCMYMMYSIICVLKDK